MRVQKTWRRAMLAVASAFAAVSASLVFATPANAYVANCSTGYSSVGAFAYCTQGTSSNYRVKVLCQNRFTFDSHWVAGPWVRRGGQTPSVVMGCAWYEHFYGTPMAQGS